MYRKLRARCEGATSRAHGRTPHKWREIHSNPCVARVICELIHASGQVYAWLSSSRGNAPNSANVCAGKTSKRKFFSLNVRGEKAPPPLNKNKSFSFSLTGGDPSENRGGVGIAFRRKGRGGVPCVAVVLWLDFNVSASAESCEVSACPTAVHKLGAPVSRLHRGAWWAL